MRIDVSNKAGGLFLLACVPVIIGICVWYANMPPGALTPPPYTSSTAVPTQQNAKSTPRMDSFDAWYYSTEKVKTLLKAPSTAKFPSFNEEFVERHKPNAFTVSGYVEAKNSYGAMLRNDFTCEILFPEAGKYQANCQLQ